MEDRRGPGAFAEAFVSGEFLVARGAGLDDQEGAVVGEDEEFVAGNNQGAFEAVLRPQGFASRGLDAAEGTLVSFAMHGAVEAVEETVVEDGGGDVVLELFVGPEGSGGILVRVEQRGTHFPPGGEQELAADDERVGGVLAHLGGPIDFPEELAIVLRNDVHGLHAEDGESGLVPAGERDWRCVSAGLGGRIPEQLAGFLVEGEAGLIGVQKESITEDDGGRGKSPSGHGCLCDGGEVGAPARFARGFVEAGDETLFAEDVEPLALDGRWGIGAAGIVLWNKILRVAFRPDWCPGGGVEGLDEVFSLGIADRVGALLADGDAGVAEMDGGSPKLLRPGGRPIVRPGSFVVVVAVSLRAAPVGPLRGGGERRADQE